MNKLSIVSNRHEFCFRYVFLPSLINGIMKLLIYLVLLSNLHFLEAFAPIFQSWQLLISSLIEIA